MPSEQIQIEVFKEGLPEHLYDNGRLFLEACDNILLEKNISTAIGKKSIIADFTIPEAVKMTKHNMAILGLLPCVSFDVRISYAGCITDALAYITQVNCENKVYLINWGFNNWQSKAKRITICDVFTDDDVITWDDATIQHLITNESYDGSGNLLDALSSPLDYYGGLLSDTGATNTSGNPAVIDMTRADLRLKINPYFILQRFFKQCGYDFKAPIFDSKFGGLQSRYLLKKDFWNYDNRGERGKAGLSTVSGTTTTIQGNQTPMPVPMLSIDFDNGSNIIPKGTPITNYAYANNTGSNQCIKCCIDIDIINNNPLATLATDVIFYFLRKDISNNIVFPVTFLYADAIFGGETIVKSELCQEISLEDGESIEFWIEAFGDNITLNSAVATFEVCTKAFYDDDTIPLNQIFDCNKTIADLVEAESQLFNILSITDEANKEVCFEIPYDAIIECTDEVVKGLFKKKHEAKELKIEGCEDGVLTCPTASILKKTIEFSFCEGDDLKVAELQEQGEEEDLFYGLAVTNDVLNAEKDEVDNKCYEPSTMCPVPTNMVNDSNYPNSHYSSFHQSNEGISYCIKSRATMNCYGSQIAFGLQRQVRFEGNILNEFLFSYQKIPSELTIDKRCELIFNSEGENLYTLFYEKYISELQSSYEISFKGQMKAFDFKNLKEGDWYCYDHKGIPLIFRITKADHRDGKVKINGLASKC